jgi:hypothetical protein
MSVLLADSLTRTRCVRKQEWGSTTWSSSTFRCERAAAALALAPRASNLCPWLAPYRACERACTWRGTRCAAFSRLLRADAGCGCGRCERQVTSGAEVEDAHEQEIFEFPWVVFDVSSKQVVDERSLYVKPTLHPQIGVECAEAALGDDAAACMDSAGTLQQAVQVRPWPRRSARERARIAAAARRERKRRANLRCGTGCRTSTTTCTGRSSPTTRTFASSPSRSFQSSAGSGVRGPLCAGVCGVVRTGCVGIGGWGCLSAVLRLMPRGWGPQRG